MGFRFPELDFKKLTIGGQSMIAFAIWATLIVVIITALVATRWSTAFVALATLVLSLLPIFFSQRFQIRLPVGFFAGIVLFTFGTIYLGEALNFYERYWWWDMLLHGGSAIGFGLVGMVFVLMLFSGDRYAAPPVAMAFIAFCFAITIGALWEIFEFSMDTAFGLNMQKSGLVDTMSDMMIDCAGAAVGAIAGFFYLKGREFGGLSGTIDEFVRLNRKYFRKSKDGNPR